MGTVLKKFGRYFFLDQIQAGGMGEIIRAWDATSEDSGRFVIVKCIKPSALGIGVDVLQMFKSEIATMMRFNHPNIAQIFDFGEVDKQPYITMEYVEGKNLREILKRAIELKTPIPFHLSALIAWNVTHALHYTHHHIDPITGEKLCVVHRDVSPQNIMVSYDGLIKVIDFGIAKPSAGSNDMTQSGFIKGKPGYLSPEQVVGEKLDGRSDVFSLGIVLWEMITGERLFTGENEFSILNKVHRCEETVRRPSLLVPNIPKELESIVMRSLSKDRDLRFQSAEDFGRSLRHFLSEFEVETRDLAGFNRGLFSKEIEEDEHRIRQLFSEAQKHIKIDLETQKGKKKETTGIRHRGEFSVDAEQLRELPIEASPPGKGPSDKGKTLAKGTQQPIRRNPGEITTATFLKCVQFMGAMIALGFLIPEITFRAFDSSRLFTLASTMNFPRTTVTVASIDDAVGSTTFRSFSISPKTESDSADSQTSLPSDTESKVPDAKTTLIKIVPLPPGPVSRVLLNGELVSLSEDLVRVPKGKKFELIVEKNGFKPWRKEWALGQNPDPDESSLKIEFKPLKFGFLSVRTIPSSEATITSEGWTWKMKTPFDTEKFPTGDYQIRLENKILELGKTVSISIQEDRIVTIEENLGTSQ